MFGIRTAVFSYNSFREMPPVVIASAFARGVTQTSCGRCLAQVESARPHERTFSRIRRRGLVRLVRALRRALGCIRLARKFRRHRRTKKTMTWRARYTRATQLGQTAADVIAFRETTTRDYCARLFSERIIAAQYVN